jgi:hypothetical protein
VTPSYEFAERLAVLAHGDTTMPSGTRLIDYVHRVAARFDPAVEPDISVAAILRDAVEKGSFEFDDLRRVGVDEHISVVVDALTERVDESERDYLARCVAHPVALRIKRVDIADKIAVEHHGAFDAAKADQMRRDGHRRLALLESLATQQPV